MTLTFTSDPVVLANITTNAVRLLHRQRHHPANATSGTTPLASGKAPDNSARILTTTLTVVAAGTGVAGQRRWSAPDPRHRDDDLWGTLLIAVGAVVVVAVRRNQFRRQRSSWS